MPIFLDYDLVAQDSERVYKLMGIEIVLNNRV